MYYRMKTKLLTQELTDVLDDDDEEETFDSMNFSQMSQFGSNLNISAAISDLLDPQKDLSQIRQVPDEAKDKRTSREFEAAEHLTTNDDAWNEKLNKPKPKENKKATKSPTVRKTMSLTIEPGMMVKKLRNPKKALSKSKLSSTNSLNNFDDVLQDTLPDLETILLEKSRSNAVVEMKKPAPPVVVAVELKNAVDGGWLNRNTAENFNKPSQGPELTSATSFGLSNLNLKSFNSASSLNCPSLNAEVKFHTLDASDHEVIGNSDEEEIEPNRPLLHIAKKRRLGIEKQIDPVPAKPIVAVSEPPQLPNKVPEKPQRQSLRKQKIVDEIEPVKQPNILETIEDGDDSDKDPTYEKEKEKTPPVMKRKRSVIKRSKEGISKITKKATKLLTRAKKAPKPVEEPEPPQEQEEEINFLIDSDLTAMTTVPRASAKELKTTEKLFDNYLRQNEAPGTSGKTAMKVVVDAKTAAKKEALKKKIATGTLNENYVRVNLKKKVFVRGKKAFSFSKYKKGVWKSKKAAALSGPEMDMRGCDGGVLTCFNCGGVGHFAQQCKKKGDNLLSLDVEIEEESAFPTLEQAAQMAEEQKLLVHSRKPETLPMSSNEIWKNRSDDDDDDDEMEEVDDKENKDGNSESNEAVVEAPVEPVS
jgi:ATP-dependent DNA helicase Q4